MHDHSIPPFRDAEYNLTENLLWIADVCFYPESFDAGNIGNCTFCGSEMETLSFHRVESFNAIVAKCNTCDRLLLSLYDPDWVWYDEVNLSSSDRLPVARTGHEPYCELSNLSGLQLLEALPNNVLGTIFSPREIEAMFLRASGKKYVRQYLYNARKKYSRFADVFGIIIDV